LHRRVSQPPSLIDITELAIYIKTTFHCSENTCY
jgi:hypothetical protein